ncbi:VWA domain-containing protein [Anaerolineae bacterium CFX9]|jgi:hypothetical protein|nr:VWA domain-containing protein [Anaerolineae bacterium CFX9]
MQGQLIYAVDILFCIDATGSMSPVIEEVKARALRFDEDLRSIMDAKGKTVDILRVKVIAFRDYDHDGDSAMLESPFFTLPNQREEFARFVSGIEANGGGDAPESGMEALALGMRSEWTKEGDKRRHVIVVFTDTSAHPIGKGSAQRSYPTGMPKDLSEMTGWWEGQMMDDNAKRMVIFAPDATPWNDIYATWSQVIHVVSQAGKGLADINYNTIVEQVANSV